MAYSPLQARGRNGRWIAKGGNKLFKTASKRTGSKKKTTSKSTSRSKGKSTARNSGVIPYARINKRSQTVGANAGAKIPYTNKRVVGGAYLRVESTTKHTTADKVYGKVSSKVFPTGSRRGKAQAAFKKNFSVNNPAIRGTTKSGNQIRLGTSRGAGPTLIVRKGSHRTAQPSSMAGVQKYDNSMRSIAGKRATKPRPQRRKASRKKS